MSLAISNLTRRVGSQTATRLKTVPLVVGLVFATVSLQGSAAAVSYNSQPDGAQLTVDGGALRIQFWSSEIIRVTYAAGAAMPELKSLSVVAQPEPITLRRQETSESLTITSKWIKVRIDKQTGRVTFLDAANDLLLQESVHGRAFAPATVAGAIVTSAEQSSDLAPDEGIYGPRQHQQVAWNCDAAETFKVTLAQANTNVGIPGMASSKGYMLPWDNPAVTTISADTAADATSAPRVLHWSSESGERSIITFAAATKPLAEQWPHIGYPNVAYKFGAGGVENEGTVPTTFAAMRLQSYQKNIHVFPDRPVDQDASFGDLLAVGEFSGLKQYVWRES